MESYSTLAEVTAQIDQVKDSLGAVLVHMNDTYLIDERSDQRLPGMARVTTTIRTIREHVRQALGEDRTLVLHSGDFLAPSRVGKKDKGKVMVQLLKRMGVNYCTLGNHEFDYGDATLRDRLNELKEAGCGVLLSNVSCADAGLLPYAEWPSGGRPIVALTGVVSRSVYESFDNHEEWKYQPEVDALWAFADRAESIPFRVILTHARRIEDRKMRKHLPPRTYFLGGHDHDIYWKEEDGPKLLKNQSNFRTMRVVLLLAGGGGMANALHQQFLRWGTRTRGEKQAEDPFPGKDLSEAYRRVITDLTAPFHPLDAAVLRKRLSELPEPEAGQESLAEVLLREGNSAEYVALYHAVDSSMPGIPAFPDDVMLEMDYDGHGPPDPEAQLLVEGALPKGADEENVVVDLRGACPGTLDATDEHLRRGPTDFGLLVAECVRLEAGADFTLLNSGAFRCDAELPPLIRLRELRDTFLYDGGRAVIVVSLPRAVVAKAVEFGRTQVGSGAYPQMSPLVLPPDVGKVAIAAYLVEAKGQGDGYGNVIAEALGVTPEELWGMTAAAPVAFSLEAAVTRWAEKVGYHPVKLAEADGDAVAAFVRFADEMFAAGLVDYDSPDWRRAMRTDEPLENKELQRLRDALRNLIRSIPEVTALEALIRSAHTIPEEHGTTAMESELASKAASAYQAMCRMYEVLAGCPRAFQTGRQYVFMFKYAAVNIAGWAM